MNRCRQTVQEDRECHSGHLEDAYAGREENPQAGCPEKLEFVYLGIDKDEIQEAKRDEALAVA